MTQQGTVTVVVEEKKEDTLCRHHWLIEAPMGPMSRGMCRICGVTREFKNYLESAPWGEDAPVTEQTVSLRISIPSNVVDNEEPE